MEVTRAIQELLEQGPLPDAALASNNRMTAGEATSNRRGKAGHPRGDRRPGYDDISWTDVLSSAMTTVTQPAYDLGREAPACS